MSEAGVRDLGMREQQLSQVEEAGKLSEARIGQRLVFEIELLERWDAGQRTHPGVSYQRHVECERFQARQPFKVNEPCIANVGLNERETFQRFQSAQMGESRVGHLRMAELKLLHPRQ